MAALNRFISRLGERGLPFFKLLKRQDKFQWTEEAERALQDLKHHLQSPPVLIAQLLGEALLLYIAVIIHVVSSAIVVDRSEEGHAFGVQRPVYFVSEHCRRKAHQCRSQGALVPVPVTGTKWPALT
jgi:hypothetical protein